MKRIILFFLFCPLFAHAETYTATWCPVIPDSSFISGAAYDVCVGTTMISCDLVSDWTWTESYTLILPVGTNAWFRVRAVALKSNNKFVTSAYSNPVQIIGGLTPPAIGGCL